MQSAAIRKWSISNVSHGWPSNETPNRALMHRRKKGGKKGEEEEEKTVALQGCWPRFCNRFVMQSQCSESRRDTETNNLLPTLRVVCPLGQRPKAALSPPILFRVFVRCLIITVQEIAVPSSRVRVLLFHFFSAPPSETWTPGEWSLIRCGFTVRRFLCSCSVPCSFYRDHYIVGGLWNIFLRLFADSGLGWLWCCNGSDFWWG